MLKLRGSDGATEWERLIDGPGHLDDRGWDIEVGPDGHPVVFGFAPAAPEVASSHIVKLHSDDGETIWSRTLAGAVFNPDDRAGWLAILDDGDVVFANKTWSPQTSYDVLLHRFAAADGTDRWHRQYHSGGTAADDPRHMIRDTAGAHLLVAGVREGNFQALKFRAEDGELAWAGSYDGPPGWFDAASRVIEAPDGTVILGGYASGATTGWDAACVGFDPVDGSRRWAVDWDAGYNETEEVAALAVSPQGDLFLGGYAFLPGTSSDMLVIRYSLGLTVGAPEPAEAFRLEAGPNPFTTRLSCTLRLPAEAAVRVGLHDLSGRRVALLHDGMLPAGAHRLSWTRGRDGELPAGVYWVRTEAGGVERAVQVVRLR